MGLLHARPSSSEKEARHRAEKKGRRRRRRRRNEWFDERWRGTRRGTIVVVVGSPNEFKYLNYKSRGRASFMAAPR